MNSIHPTFPRPVLRQPVSDRQPNVPVIYGLHHHAFRCRNAEETRQFYEEFLGLPLAAALTEDYVPSTGEFSPFYHIFFELADGSYLAFFDLLDGKAYTPDPDTEPWVNHLALEISSREDLLHAKERLTDAGVSVLGIVDHHWFESIYFFDPNGIRLELVYRTAPLDQMREKHVAAREVLQGRDSKAAERRAALEGVSPLTVRPD